ncbi:MAG: hypothetical protein ABIP78_04550 [Pyrinomonadaceae bacterium]
MTNGYAADAFRLDGETNARARMTEDCRRGIAKFLEKQQGWPQLLHKPTGKQGRYIQHSCEDVFRDNDPRIALTHVRACATIAKAVETNATARMTAVPITFAKRTSESLIRIVVQSGNYEFGLVILGANRSWVSFIRLHISACFAGSFSVIRMMFRCAKIFSLIRSSDNF